MNARMLDDILAERVMLGIARRVGRLGRLEAHVVPAEILEMPPPHLAEALGPHRRAGRALAGEQAGGERSERLGFAGTPSRPLTGRPRGGRSHRRDADWPGDAVRRARRGEDGAAEILFEPIGDIVPQLDRLRLAERPFGIDFHHRAAVDHRGGEIGAVVERDRGDGAVLRQRDRGFVGDLGLGRRAR